MLPNDAVIEILTEIRQKSLRSFNVLCCNKIKDEIVAVEKQIAELEYEAENGEINEEISINFALLHAYKERYNRVIKAYKWHRLYLIQQDYFATEKEDHKLLNLEEAAFEKEFNELMDDYLEDYTFLDINNRDPPLIYYVQVLVLEDCGIVMSGDEFIDLKKDRLYFLRRTDIKHLIENGSVKLI